MLGFNMILKLNSNYFCKHSHLIFILEDALYYLWGRNWLFKCRNKLKIAGFVYNGVLNTSVYVYKKSFIPKPSILVMTIIITNSKNKRNICEAAALILFIILSKLFHTHCLNTLPQKFSVIHSSYMLHDEYVSC